MAMYEFRMTINVPPARSADQTLERKAYFIQARDSQHAGKQMQILMRDTGFGDRAFTFQVWSGDIGDTRWANGKKYANAEAYREGRGVRTNVVAQPGECDGCYCSSCHKEVEWTHADAA